MANILLSAEDVQNNLTANENNSVVSKSTLTFTSVPANDRESTTLLFSKELATKINPERPDITASLIIYGLYLWQTKWVHSFQYQPMVNGRRGCYRSLSELQTSYPWLTEEAIRKALNRAEKKLKSLFTVDRNHPEADRGKLHFLLSPLLIRTYKFNADRKKGLLQLKTEDAMKYGILEAVLIANLEYITGHSRNRLALKDQEGRIYRKLSPTELTKLQVDGNGDTKSILPFSRKALTEALGRLIRNGVFIEHPSKAGFYRVKREYGNVTKVADDVTKVASHVTKVASGVTKVAGQSVVSDSNVLISSALQHIPETSYTNSNSNADSNENTKYLLPSTAPLRSAVTGVGENASPSAKKLMELVNNGLTAIRQKSIVSPIYDINAFSEQTTSHHAITDNTLPPHDINEYLLYDYIPVDPNTGKHYSRKAEIDYTIDNLKLFFDILPIKYTSKDLDKLRQLFEDHPFLDEDHVKELIGFLQPQNDPLLFGKNTAPKSGHDFHYWARRIKTVGKFLQYLPQLTREHHVNEVYGICGWRTEFERDETGKPLFDFSQMEEPYLSLAFYNDSTHPITHVEVESDDAEVSGTTRQRPVYYAEFVGLPGIERVDLESNPIIDRAA